MSGSWDELRDLARHERDVLAHYKQMAGAEDEPIVQPSAGGAGLGPHTVLILAVPDNRFECQWMGDDGEGYGAPFPVRAFSLPVVDGLAGQQLLEDCDPRRVPGDLLRVEYRTQPIGNGQELTAWWALQEFTLFGGECPCGQG